MNSVEDIMTAAAVDVPKVFNPTSCSDSSADATDESNQTSQNAVDVLIVGAGIGGLVTALCLHRAGFSVRVYERAQVLEPIGFGINLQPYCVKVLHELGLGNEMNEISICNDKAAFYSRNGQFAYEQPRGVEAGFRWPMYSTHRGHFQQLLLRHVREEADENIVQLGQKLVAFRSQTNHVEADLVNSITGHRTTARAKILIGADGVNSTVRKLLYPDEGLPLWEGHILWRGVTETDQIYLNGRTMVYAGNPANRIVVIFPVSNNVINWSCLLRAEELGRRPAPEPTDWVKLGHIEDLLPLVSDMKLDFLDIHHLISSSSIVNQFPMTDRDPLPRWTHDRVTLLGDAAHPMYPRGGNGASQAILDARELVLAFRQHGATPQGLQAYEDLRRPVANAFVQSARQPGPEQLLQTIDEHSPLGFHHLLDVLSQSDIDALNGKYKQIFIRMAQQLDQEPPLF